MSERALDTSRAAAVDWRTSKPVTAPHAMVVSAQHLATEVGVEILKRGGNAIDAAVAVGYAEAVVPPCCGNIGGGGFMRSAGRRVGQACVSTCRSLWSPHH